MKNLVEQTIAFRVYANTSDLLGIATVELPELPNMTETISGTGVLGEYDSPAIGSFSSMSVKLKWNSLTEKGVSLLNPFVPLLLELKSSQQRANNTTGAKLTAPVEISLFGQVKSSSLGTLETAKKMDSETEIEIMRINVMVNGKQKILLDKQNMIYAIDGVDIMLPIRADLGLAF